METLSIEALSRVRDSLDALTDGNTSLARKVIEGDAEVNQQYRSVLKELKQSIRSNPDRIETWLRLINTARNLERIADHAVNIAEGVIYLKEGNIVRHVNPR